MLIGIDLFASAPFGSTSSDGLGSLWEIIKEETVTWVEAEKKVASWNNIYQGQGVWKDAN